MKKTVYEMNNIFLKETFNIDNEEVFRNIKMRKGKKLAWFEDIIEYHPLLKSRSFIRLVEASEGELALKMLGDFVSDQICCYNFWLSGKKVFNVTKDLSMLLFETEFKTLRRFIKLPYRCIYLRYEDAPLDLYADFDDTWRKLDGVFVFSGIFGHSYRTFLDERENYCYEKLESPQRFEILFYIYSKTSREFPGNYYKFYLPFGGDPDDMLDEKFLKEEISKCSHKEEMPMLFEILKLTLNSVLYINSSGVDLKFRNSKNHIKKLKKRLKFIKSSKKRKALKREAGNSSELDYIDVGRRIVIGKNLRSGGLETTGDSKHRKLRYRFWVRGHWHRYRKLEKNIKEGDKVIEKIDDKWNWILKWVMPYMKGPELQEVVSRQYLVKNK